MILFCQHGVHWSTTVIWFLICVQPENEIFGENVSFFNENMYIVIHFCFHILFHILENIYSLL